MTIWAPLATWLVVCLIVAPRISRRAGQWKALFEKQVQLRLERLHIFVSLSSVKRLIFSILAGLAIIGLMTQSIVLFVCLLGICVGTLFAGLHWRLARHTRQLRYQIPSALELVGTSLRSGLSIRSSLLQVGQQTSGPISRELLVLEKMQRIGVPLNQAISDWGQRSPLPEIRLFSFVMAVSTASGGSLADSLDRLANSFRERLMLEEKVNALTAQGRLQAWIMVALPIILAMALTAIDPDSMSPLWRTDMGRLVVGVIALLELLGLVWIRRLIRLES